MTPQEAQGLAQYLFQTLETEFATTRKILAAVPSDQLNFKLGEKGRTAAELMWHMVQSDRGFAEGIANLNFDSWTPEGAPPQTSAEILAAFDRDIPPVFERVKSLTPAQLATPVNFMNFMTLPVGDLCRLVVESHYSPPRPAERVPAGHERARALDLRRQRG